MRPGPTILALTLALLSTGSALAASNEELSGLSNHEYTDYARDRFEWLTGEGRSSHASCAVIAIPCSMVAG